MGTEKILERQPSDIDAIEEHPVNGNAAGQKDSGLPLSFNLSGALLMGAAAAAKQFEQYPRGAKAVLCLFYCDIATRLLETWIKYH